MLSRWLNTSIRAAETALGDGRIDEAYDRLTSPDARRDRRADRLLDELGRRLMARARLHAQAGRYRDVLSDLDKLAGIDRVGGDAIALRKRVEDEQAQRVARHTAENDAFQRASDQLQAGRLETGRISIEQLEDPQRRERLREELDARMQRSEQLLGQARSALAAGDALTAATFWREARERFGRTDSADALASELSAALRRQIDGWIGGGALERLGPALAAIAALLPLAPVLAEQQRAIELIQTAAAQLNRSDFVALRDTLLRLTSARGDASWARETLKHVEQLDAARAGLLSSPLGRLSAAVEKNREILIAPETIAAQDVRRAAPAAPQPPPVPARPSAAPLLLLIDGTGSALVLRRDIVKIGRAGGSSGIDVPMPADIQSHHADVLYNGEDYFLVAHGPVRVNQRSVSRTLLRDGDRIALGASTKLVFQKPSAKSETAVLRLADRCRLPQDVSLVVLFRDTCLIGPQESCHVRTREGDDRVVIFERDGKLLARRQSSNSPNRSPAVELSPAAPIEIGEMRLTAKEYDARERGGMA